MPTLFDELKTLLEQDPRLSAGGELLKNHALELETGQGLAEFAALA